jgi:L-aminopeptidase/D-esterase-like protein
MHARGPRLAGAAAVSLGIAIASCGALDAESVVNNTLTAVPGITVGHAVMDGRPTGCTVVLAGPAGAVAGVDVRGSAPGTRETDLLDPVNTVDRVHGIVLAGGSAFGLDAASGVMRWLEEHDIGFDMRVARVPIVPAAILFDLSIGDARIRPDAGCGYRAAAAASDAPVAEGNLGAGAGATIGKARGLERAMKGGLGSAAIRQSGGLIVAALAAVNPYGDVIDPSSGAVVAGVRTEDGRGLADLRRLMRGGTSAGPGLRENTTLVIVATNARLSKTQATKVAQMAQDGLARAIWPVHTPADGDTAFALATGTLDADASVLDIGALAADAVADAIVRGARAATGLPGLPAARDLR